MTPTALTPGALDEIEFNLTEALGSGHRWMPIPLDDVRALIASARSIPELERALRYERDVQTQALADLAKAREERDEAEAALEYQRDAIKSAVNGENEARARLAALEARAADARTVCEWVVSGFGVVATAAVLDANNRAHAAARRYLANAPAAPAKADEMWPQLIEAVELLREAAAPDSWRTPNRDDWRARRAALLAAIDAGRARAKETK